MESGGWQQCDSKSILLRLPPLHSHRIHVQLPRRSDFRLSHKPGLLLSCKLHDLFTISPLNIYSHRLTFLGHLSLFNANATGKEGSFNLHRSVTNLSGSLFSPGNLNHGVGVGADGVGKTSRTTLYAPVKFQTKFRDLRSLFCSPPSPSEGLPKKVINTIV